MYFIDKCILLINAFYCYDYNMQMHIIMELTQQYNANTITIQYVK